MRQVFLAAYTHISYIFYQRYKQFSLQFYTILMAHADDLQAVSVDEALIDVTSSVARIRTELDQHPDRMDDGGDPAKDFAESIRSQVRRVTGCEGLYRRAFSISRG